MERAHKRWWTREVFTLSVFETRLPPSGVYWVLRCDAAVEGTTEPALCGALYAAVWIHRLTWLTHVLPISALEYAAQGHFNLHTFDAEARAGRGC